MVIQYTTPTERAVVEGADLTGCDVWVSFQQGRRELDVKASSVTYDGTDSTVEVPLTQLQTAGFRPGTVKLQVNWVTSTNERDATILAEVEWGENLLERVVEYGDE